MKNFANEKFCKEEILKSIFLFSYSFLWAMSQQKYKKLFGGLYASPSTVYF
jgi:hypothetical protein